jgi:hypothetical protein
LKRKSKSEPKTSKKKKKIQYTLDRMLEVVKGEASKGDLAE